MGLRARLVAELEREEGRPEGSYKEVIPRTVVTTGSAQLIYLVCEALLDPGDIVLVESPTYFVFLGPLETRGARAIRIPIDEGGLRLDELEATLERLEAQGQLERVKLIYTIPEHANPTGISLAADRRGPLVELARRWSKKHRIFVLEDAAYRGLSFGAGEPPSVWSHDREGDTVILARTFSKTFSPGLKVGYGVLPEGLIDPILYLKGNHDFGTANFNQRLLERVLADGSYHRHVARLNGAVSPQVRGLPVGPGGVDRGPGFRGPLDPSRRGAVRLDDRTRRAGYRVRRPAVPALRAGGGDLRAGRIRLRRRAVAPAEEPHPPDLRGTQRGRAGRRGTPPGGGLECMPGSGRLTPTPARKRGAASSADRSRVDRDPDGWPGARTLTRGPSL